LGAADALALGDVSAVGRGGGGGESGTFISTSTNARSFSAILTVRCSSGAIGWRKTTWCVPAGSGIGLANGVTSTKYPSTYTEAQGRTTTRSSAG
jgi:hypothetical protein